MNKEDLSQSIKIICVSFKGAEAIYQSATSLLSKLTGYELLSKRQKKPLILEHRSPLGHTQHQHTPVAWRELQTSFRCRFGMMWCPKCIGPTGQPDSTKINPDRTVTNEVIHTNTNNVSSTLFHFIYSTCSRNCTIQGSSSSSTNSR